MYLSAVVYKKKRFIQDMYVFCHFYFFINKIINTKLFLAYFLRKNGKFATLNFREINRKYHD